MKIVYNKNLVGTELINEGTEFESTITVYNINVFKDIRIELDSYTINSEVEESLINIGILISLHSFNIIDYNDLRKYLIINLLPIWDSLTIKEQSQLKSYYVVPNDYTWGSEQPAIYKLLVDNATKCREARIDQGRSYVSLFYIADVQKSMDFFIDTELLMNQYIKGKIPALEAFINDTSIAGFDYTTNGFDTKGYYNVTIKDQLNYLLFR